MPRSYPYLVLHRHRWVVRMIVPKDVREALRATVFKVSTGQSDEHHAVLVAAPIIAELKTRIKQARQSLRSSSEIDEMAGEYRARQSTDPESATAFLLSAAIPRVLAQQGISLKEFGHQVREAGYDAYAAFRLLPDRGATARKVDEIIGCATPFLTYLGDWKAHACLKPRPLDQAISTLKQFADAVRQPIEQVEAKHVQTWIDDLIRVDQPTGLSAKTVRRKLSELRTYWKHLQSRQIVPEERLPSTNRRVKDPPSRLKIKDERRQRFRPEDVVRLWRSAEQAGDTELAKTIKIAAYSGARIEGVAQLTKARIRTDPETGVRFMQMTDKTAAGHRYVPIHPALVNLIDEAICNAGSDGYLIHSNAKNKYGERSQPIGKRFGRLKTQLDFDDRFVFHSIRKTVTALFKSTHCPEAVAADVIGHNIPTMTYGLYAGETRMDERARWLEQSIRYPTD